MHVILNMIVRNEKRVIERALASVRPHIHEWVIVDTGSTDGTQRLIKKALAGIPGKLHQRPWKNFSHNRNEALAFCAGKDGYVFHLDADDELRVDPGFVWPDNETALDSYHMPVRIGALTHSRVQLHKNDIGWKFRGVVHEYLGCSDKDAKLGKPNGVIGKCLYVCRTDGKRGHDRKRYREDARMLLRALKKEPLNPRYWFYLGESHYHAGDYALALPAYEKRITLTKNSYEDERAFAVFKRACCLQNLGRPRDAVVGGFLDAFAVKPSRAESLHALAEYLRKADRVREAYPFACAAATIPRPIPGGVDGMFVDESVYSYRAIDEFALAAFYTGRYEVAAELTSRLLLLAPPHEATRIRTNLEFCLEKLPESLRSKYTGHP